jgi:hypothetical protein
VDQDVCVLSSPPWLLAFVLEGVAQGIRPGTRQPQPDDQSRKGITEPFVSTLLSSTFPTHFVTDDSPENVVVDVFVLVFHHFFDDRR